MSLLDFAPLAELCNVILGGLNELRLIAPTSLGPEVTSRIQVIFLHQLQKFVFMSYMRNILGKRKNNRACEKWQIK